MHLIFGTRGVKHERDLFVTTMQGQFFPWTRKNLKTGENETIMVQGALRPIELWEYIFPEESLPHVLAMLEIQERNEASNSVCFKDVLGMKAVDAKAAVLRKMLNLKKIPAMPEAVKHNLVHLRGMGIHPIGIKEDDRRDMPWGYNQEAL